MCLLISFLYRNSYIGIHTSYKYNSIHTVGIIQLYTSIEEAIQFLHEISALRLATTFGGLLL